MSEIYSEQDVLDAVRRIYIRVPMHTSSGIIVSSIRDTMAWTISGDHGPNGTKMRERFFCNHSKKWVLRKLRLLRRQGNVIDRKFRWYLSDAEVVAQKLLGNLP